MVLAVWKRRSSESKHVVENSQVGRPVELLLEVSDKVSRCDSTDRSRRAL